MYRKSLIFYFSIILSLSALHVTAQGFNMKKMANVTGLPGGDCSAVFGYKDAGGNEFAIIGSKTAINIFNVNDCGNPVNVLTLSDTYNTSWREFASFQNYVYSVCDGPCYSGLHIINMNTMTATVQTNIFTKAHTIFVEQATGRMYVMGSKSSTGQDRLLIYTLDTEVVDGITYNGTPANPALIKIFPTTYIHDMFVKNNLGYASHIYDYKLRVWDLTNVNSITETGHYYYDSGKYNHSSWLHNDGVTLVEATELPRGEPLTVLKKIPGNPALQLVGTLKEPLEFPIASDSRPHNPHINGNYMYVACYEDGVQVFDVANVSSQNTIKRVAYYDTYIQNNGTGYPSGFAGCWGVYPFLTSGCILASDINNGLFTLKMELPQSDGANPGKVSSVKGGDLYFENAGQSIILRSEKGYCYRLVADANNNLTTQRTVCHVYNATNIQLENNDIAVSDAESGLVIVNGTGSCQRFRISDTGTFTSEGLNCSDIARPVKVHDSDLVVETYTKGLILKNQTGTCYRIRVNDSGNFIITPLTSCP